MSLFHYLVLCGCPQATKHIRGEKSLGRERQHYIVELGSRQAVFEHDGVKVGVDAETSEHEDGEHEGRLDR